MAFKEVEFILEYNDRQSVKFYLNGPPLPRIDKSAPGITVIEPEGLQILDELAFGDSHYDERDKIVEIWSRLRIQCNYVLRYQKNISLQHRIVFEGARTELIRIFTLGLTGFDTPGSLNALPEARVAMQSMASAFAAYKPLLDARIPGAYPKIEAGFAKSVKKLSEAKDFDRFDRLSFLRECVNPLFELLGDLQRQLGVEYLSEVSSKKQSLTLNLRAKQIFSTDLLNAYAFAKMPEAEITPERIALGRLLFFDPILSANNERSCASCHDPAKAFTDGLDKSIALGRADKINRNSPTLINCVYSDGYFYDLREPFLERQMKHVFMSADEFGQTFEQAAEKLRHSEEYAELLFRKAYPNAAGELFGQAQITNAIAAYVTTLVGFNSPFDRYARGETHQIGPAVARGFNLFMGKAACGTCHFAPVFNGTVPPWYDESESEVLGVPASKHPPYEIDGDWGRAMSGRPYDEAAIYIYSFKTTTVRNAALTAPYMHNGVFETLEEVMDFYNKGGGAGLGIALPHQTLSDAPLKLNKREIGDIIAFMRALTDTSATTAMPDYLPGFDKKPEWNSRKMGGIY